MEREILFRGKRIDNNEWIEGFLFIQYDNTCWIYQGSGEKFEVEKESIGPLTPFKDRNGNKIWEGDSMGHPDNYVMFSYGSWNINCDIPLSQFLNFEVIPLK